ncbi:cation:proton antiporter regulatory subunit [Hydrogenothermus marinus]|uniref:Potassium/proton antiporter regulatory subunit (CPA2 family) n=1 Tax=Hydrogenothermus marinus TaxID=133270 RepID=A0A3M0BLU8_9AQUI|nr:cation:proton antiporter regulatory subunit [Hydrogenothermus marinus]RMA97566.1 potassium/proton antiporter regulatory subunit (CPA2 family) [Hydrogenothermus marinus]
MEFKETDLPGIGKKYSITTSNGDKIVTVIHLTGKREIFYFEKDDMEDPLCDIVLNEEEATQLGSILTGTYFKPEQEKLQEVLVKNLAIEWVKVPLDSPLANKKISELEIRKKTGVTVISIIRGEETIINPLPDEIIKPNDTLVLVGTREQIEHFIKEFKINA